MITFTWNRIRLQPGAILTPTPFTLYYKEQGDAGFTLVASGVYVDTEGYILASPLPSILLDEAGYYTLRAVNDFCGDIYDQIFYLNQDTLFVWVEDDSYCEQELPLNLVDTITGFADPYNLMYDEPTGRMYAIDAYAPTQGSNIYYFDPLTIVSAADVTPVGGLNVVALASAFDTEARMIYISGPNTGGMITYNIATNSTSTLAFGANASFARQTLAKFDDVIICIDTPSSTVYLIDAPSLTITNTIPFSSIPNYTQRFSGGTIVQLVNGQWWVIASQGSGLGVPASSIGVYNQDFSVLLDTIPLPGQATWTNSAYWRSVRIIDGLMFIYDMGSNQLLTVTLDTNIVTSRYTFTNREGKSNSSLGVIQDAVTGEYYISGNWRNTANSEPSAIPITYKLDSTTFTPNTVYPDTEYGANIVRSGATDVLVGVSPGELMYPSSPVGAATDGIVNIFSKSGSGNNTGIKNVLTLQQINTATDTPTGQTKPNIPSDPNYISPYQDLVNCPITYTQLCPDAIFTVVGSVAEYEYSLALSTANNPAIASIVLEQIDVSDMSLLDTISVPKNVYQHGYITKIGSNSNQINLLFKDADDNTLSTCVDLFTIP